MRLLFAIGIASTVTATAALAVAPRPLLSGSYAALVDVKSQSGTGCVGEYSELSGVMIYGGIDAPRFSVRAPLSGPSVQTEIFTITGGRGTKHTSGTFSWRARGFFTWDVHGTFSADFSELDRYSFVARIMENYGKCVEEDTISATRVGPTQ